MSQEHPWNDPAQTWRVSAWTEQQEKCEHKWTECGFWNVGTWKDCDKCGAEAWPESAVKEST